MGLIRDFLYYFKPPVGRAQAIEIARAEFERQGWGWKETILVQRDFGTWTISQVVPKGPSRGYAIVSMKDGGIVAAKPTHGY